MKKWLIACVLILILLAGSVYVFTPVMVHVRERVIIPTTTNSLKRILFTPHANWNNWWPGDTTGHAYRYNNASYALSDIKFNSLIITVQKNKLHAVTSIDLIPVTADSSELVWQADIPVSYNPLTRLQRYRQAKRLGRDIKAILAAIQSHFSDAKNIYGFDIGKGSIRDSILVSTFANSNGYPGTAFIYQLLDQLKKYIALAAAKEAGIPMLNINTTDSITYLVRVAIPIDKKLKPSGNISYKSMPAGTPALVIDVRGGPAVVEKAFHELENYMNDYRRVAPAIPFLSLVTDRSREPDSSKWVTRIYYPVM
jgi:hypothetical protein